MNVLTYTLGEEILFYSFTSLFLSYKPKNVVFLIFSCGANLSQESVYKASPATYFTFRVANQNRATFYVQTSIPVQRRFPRKFCNLSPVRIQNNIQFLAGYENGPVFPSSLQVIYFFLSLTNHFPGLVSEPVHKRSIAYVVSIYVFRTHITYK